MKAFIIMTCMALAAFSHAETLSFTMQKCRELALANSEDVKMVSNNVDGAELQRKLARDSRLPRISGMAMGIYMAPNTEMAGMTLQMQGTWLAGINLTQPIYAGGKIVSGIKLAKMGKEAMLLQQRATRASVIADADNAYWSYIAVREKQMMLLHMLDYINSIYDQIKNSVDVQMATSSDLLRVEAKRSDFNYQLELVNNGLEMCRLNLCNILGVDFDTQIQPADTTVVVNDAVTADFNNNLVNNRPEYKLMQCQIDISREQVKQVRGDFLPTLALTAGYAHYGNIKLKGFASDGMGGMNPFSQSLSDGSFSVMLSLSVPILNWGECSRKVKKQKLEVENARLQLEKNSKLMSIELTNARNNLNSSMSLISTAEIGERDAAEALRVMTDRYELGMCTLTDLLEAQSQWYSARSNVIEACTKYKIYETDYMRAAGLLD